MTLLIACLLIYHLDMASWWYGVAAVLWLCHMAAYLKLVDVSKLIGVGK